MEFSQPAIASMVLTSLKIQLEASFTGNLKYVDIIWGSPTGRNFKTRSMLLNRPVMLLRMTHWEQQQQPHTHTQKKNQKTKNKEVTNSAKIYQSLNFLEDGMKSSIYFYTWILLLWPTHYICVNSGQVSFSGVLINMSTLILMPILYCPITSHSQSWLHTKIMQKKIKISMCQPQCRSFS